MSCNVATLNVTRTGMWLMTAVSGPDVTVTWLADYAGRRAARPFCDRYVASDVSDDGIRRDVASQRDDGVAFRRGAVTFSNDVFGSTATPYSMCDVARPAAYVTAAA